MVENGGFDVAARLESFRCAFRGVWTMLASQQNARIHLLATVCACGLGLLIRISLLEWCAIVVAIVMVWTAEALNTAFELLCDATSPEFHPLIQKGKDVAAGAVLLTAVGAAVIGLLVFGPHLLRIAG
jgi:diacylglycerol kinase (ATP)